MAFTINVTGNPDSGEGVWITALARTLREILVPRERQRQMLIASIFYIGLGDQFDDDRRRIPASNVNHSSDVARPDRHILVRDSLARKAIGGPMVQRPNAIEIKPTQFGVGLHQAACGGERRTNFAAISSDDRNAVTGALSKTQRDRVVELDPAGGPKMRSDLALIAVVTLAASPLLSTVAGATDFGHAPANHQDNIVRVAHQRGGK